MPEPPGQVGRPTSARRSTVLLIDDHVDICEGVAMYLRWSELTVHEASNGLDALRAVELAAPDVIVLDFNMPVMNGRDVLDELKANPATQHIPVLVVTGEDCARPLGAARLLRKPVSPPELLACLLQLLRRAAPADPGESGGRTATD